MDAKDVKAHVSNLEKGVKEKLPAQYLLDILGALKKEVVATEQLLRDTKVGMAVNKLRMNPDKTVSELAKEIVAKWKKDVHSKTKPGSTSDVKKERNSTASPTTGSNPMSPPKPSGKKPDSNSKVDPSKRNKTTDKITWTITSDQVRNNCIGAMYDALVHESDASSDHIFNLAKAVETSVFSNNKSKTDQPYRRRMQVLFLNLKDTKNNLRIRVVSGEITPERLATMETSEMASAERRKQDQQIIAQNEKDSMMPKSEKSISDQLTCGKCGKKRVSYTQAQTRSADEPMTTFCTCELCGHRWKFS
ncbi:transcription factor S-II, central domain-containing protein [Morchella snyderi]|nr:transcription factor S-II, central domain-containing protein [Morchella snyderi]